MRAGKSVEARINALIEAKKKQIRLSREDMENYLRGYEPLSIERITALLGEKGTPKPDKYSRMSNDDLKNSYRACYEQHRNDKEIPLSEAIMRLLEQ